MIVCFNSPWRRLGKNHTETYGNVEYVFNRFHPDAVAVVDVKWPRTPLSEKFPPERRVWVHIEPIALTDYFQGFEQYYAGGIVSWHTGLEQLPQTRQYRHGGRGGKTRDTDAGKIFGFGGHVSAKNNPALAGYRLRHQILTRHDEITIPSMVFNYRGKWGDVGHDYPRDNTDEVMDYMFHLVIENCRERHYFTEKIIRAFANFCVPLYCGDPCIAEEFDTGGIILINEENWLQTINALTPADYYERMESVRRNYFRSMPYWTKMDRIAGLVNSTPALRKPIGDGGIYRAARAAATPGCRLEESPRGYEIVDSETHRRVAACNGSAAAVFALCDGSRTIDEVIDEIGETVDAKNASSLASDVTAAAMDLIGLGALCLVPNPDTPELSPAPVENYRIEQSGRGFVLTNGRERTPLNAPAALIWTLCDGRRNLSGIVERICEELGEKDRKRVAKDVCQTVMRFSDRGQVSMHATDRTGTIRAGRADVAGPAVRPRILFLLTRFPQLSETYIKTEIAALRDDYDIAVVAFEDSNLRYRNHHPYRVARVRGNTMQDDISDAHGALAAAIEEFRPDILHTHYLNNVPIVAQMAERFDTAFTVRAHSYDVMAREFRTAVGDGKPRPGAFLGRVSHLLNDDRCLGALTFPYTLPAFATAGVHDDKVIPCYPVVDFSAFYDRSPNDEGFLNVEPCLPKKAVTDFIDLARLMPGSRFSLYGMGHQIDSVKAYNRDAGSPVTIEDTVEPEHMPAVYKQHDWLIYTASFNNGNVGWPLAVFEAQAAGLGVCIANLHPHVADQLGGGGFVYDAIGEVPAIVSQPYPDEMREAGFENAKKADIHRHKHLLTDLWQSVLQDR
ncbi:MAG: PqqD family peptide modification chaperone [Proteobacteria bacterium]|nr:MAG: PqqD family peptide modification chaperone [Pseudomonadota bacterium]